ncbi:putative disease resistance protein RGA3 [Acorus calamus]|uniref:Disease resistance protein RGA3 n=1 Tax=Acorus calamus TaxID=4465 RepID=A0AAV9FEH2_ACOCL|nr:putative disease resistance protein RGA3 [Acorus calamus]
MRLQKKGSTLVGMGGLGKTTLAQLVYADADEIPEEDHFQLKMWIHVSEYFSATKISKEIFDCVAEPHEKPCNIENPNLLHDMLCQKLKRKRFLLVLDDVWDEQERLLGEWQKLKAPLNHGEKGSKVVITTRNSKVADIMQTTKLVRLHGLSFDDSWLLFKGMQGLKRTPEGFQYWKKLARTLLVS